MMIELLDVLGYAEVKGLPKEPVLPEWWEATADASAE
jgi:hypothetical protein